MEDKQQTQGGDSLPSGPKGRHTQGGGPDGGQAEVSHPHNRGIVLAQQYILGFDISVNEAYAVQLRQHSRCGYMLVISGCE